MIGATALGVPAVFGTLLIVAVIACVSPLIVSLHGGLRIPAVVVEVLLGALVGPGGLAIAQPNEATRVLSFLGLGFLLFVAGLEVEPDAMARNLNKVSIAFLL
ncbi:MAG TPA: cation:proton antiporter, partial [Acidimicrobiales bacterium]|nr:cation:proton antiporter [Acidimicrobiales bacterium]